MPGQTSRFINVIALSLVRYAMPQWYPKFEFQTSILG